MDGVSESMALTAFLMAFAVVMWLGRITKPQEGE